MTRQARAWNAVASLLLLAVCGGAMSGCVAAGLASGPLMVAIQMVADRSVERTYPSDLGTTWTATTDALGRMQVRIAETDRTAERWTLTGTGENIRVKVELLPATSGMTKLSVRVEAGKLVADRQTAVEILNQVGLSVTALTQGPSRERPSAPDVSSESLAALQGEIRRLRSDIEGTRARGRAGDGHTGTPEPVIPATSGVISIPESYGLTTLPPAGTRSVSPPLAKRVEDREAAAVAVPHVTARDADVVDPALAPVGALIPVSPLSGPRPGGIE